MVGPVLAYDARRGTELVATLEAWFAAGGRPAETAQRLHVHPNTVAQRLDRVGTLLGDDWRDPARGARRAARAAAVPAARADRPR